VANLLGDEYKNLYQSYYSGTPQTKRKIAADDSLRHVLGVIGDDKFARLVDVGAGEGSLLALLDTASFCERLYGLEISSSGVDAIRARALNRLEECQSFDGYRIPYADKFFDLAVCMHVLEHVEHERLVLREMSRVARRLVIEVPLENGIRVRNSMAVSRPYGHINYYSPETFTNLLETSGLRIIRSQVFGYSLEYEQHVFGGLKGRIKHAVRQGLLGLSRRWAPWVLTYVFTVYCEPV